MSSKSVKYILVLLLIGGSLWYFLIRDYNYRIAFNSSQVPGIVYDHILNWKTSNQNDKLVISTVDRIPFREIDQRWTIGDSIFSVRWVIDKDKSSRTMVKAYIKDEQHGLKQNLLVPFLNNEFVNRSVSTVQQIGEDLLNNSSNFKISEVTKGQIPEMHYAYIELESRISEKAAVMVRNIGIVMNYIKSNNITLTSQPFLEITEWDIAEDRIKFNFCFPVEERESFPKTDLVQFRVSKKRDALKTIFNGNYRISDKSWYAILDHAQENNITIDQLPIEIYLNDPHSGGNDLEWEAEVYMPLMQ